LLAVVWQVICVRRVVRVVVFLWGVFLMMYFGVGAQGK